MAAESEEEQSYVRSGVGTQTWYDLLKRAANILYLVAAAVFLWGLWIDWQNPGVVYLEIFQFADEPYPNSGVFVAAVLVGIIGYGLSKAGDLADLYYREDVDQTQEWVVDVQREQ